MKILFDDKARTAVITATNATLEYPATNLADVFLNRPYVASGLTDVITLDYGSNVPIDSIFLAYCNCAFVLIQIYNATNTLVHSVTKNVLRPIETIYFTSVDASRIVLTLNLEDGISPWVLGYRASTILRDQNRIIGGDYLATESGDFLVTEGDDYLITEASLDGHAITVDGNVIFFDYDPAITSNVKMKGVGFGDSTKFKGALWARNRSRSSTTTSVRSPMGQVMRNKGVVLRAYTLTVPYLNVDDFRDLDEKLTTLDKDYPVYVDITEDTDGSEDPIYATVDDNWSVSDRNQGQDISIPILEAK